MPIKELDPGQTHAFPATPLIVEVAGETAGVVLLALDQASQETKDKRVRQGALLLVPSPRRLRLVARPVGTTTFPAGTTLGLSLRTEGAAAAMVEIVVARVDVAALREYELAVLEFAPGRSVLSVTRTRAEVVDVVDGPSVVDEMYREQDAISTRSVSVIPEDAGHAWLQPGRYALREAGQLPGAAEPESVWQAWALALDGSVSMRRLHELGQLDRLVGLVSGVLVEWTGRWATASVVAGTQPAEVSAPSTQPQALTVAAFGAAAPSSWSAIGTAVEHLCRRVGPRGGVVILTDGVPGDLARVVDVAMRFPDISVVLISFGVSAAYALDSDAQRDWWREELGAANDLAALPNAKVIALQHTDRGSLQLSGKRAAELALRLTRSTHAVAR